MIAVAVDPPQGVAAWGPRGPLWVVQGRRPADTREAIAGKLAALDGADVRCAVERPFGLARKSNPRSVVSQSVSSGWWLRDLEIWSGSGVWHPEAKQWRSVLGYAGARSNQAKAQALILADDACQEAKIPIPRGPKGGTWEHGSEALCLALAAYVRARGDDLDEFTSKFLKKHGIR